MVWQKGAPELKRVRYSSTLFAIQALVPSLHAHLDTAFCTRKDRDPFASNLHLALVTVL